MTPDITQQGAEYLTKKAREHLVERECEQCGDVVLDTPEDDTTIYCTDHQ